MSHTPYGFAKYVLVRVRSRARAAAVTCVRRRPRATAAPAVLNRIPYSRRGIIGTIKSVRRTRVFRPLEALIAFTGRSVLAVSCAENEISLYYNITPWCVLMSSCHGRNCTSSVVSVLPIIVPET